MKRIALVVLVAAVGASSTTSLGARASAPAAPAGYELQESIRVPVLGAAGVSSRRPLAAGKTYVVRVTGTLYVGVGALGPGFGDAEYAYYASGQFIDKCRDGTDLGVAIDDTNVTPGHVKKPHWGAYRQTHVYTARLRGTGQKIVVDYHDCNYGDNKPSVRTPGTGPLTVWIYAPVA
jgi:hypothetical protein